MSSSTIIPTSTPGEASTPLVPAECPSSLPASPLRTLFSRWAALDVDAGQPERVVAALVRVSRCGPRRAAALGDARGEPHRRRRRRRRLWRRLVGPAGVAVAELELGVVPPDRAASLWGQTKTCGQIQGAGKATDTGKIRTGSATDTESAADGRHGHWTLDTGHWTGSDVGKDAWYDVHQLRGRKDRRLVYRIIKFGKGRGGSDNGWDMGVVR